MQSLSSNEARRIALAAQFMASATRSSANASWRTMSRILDQINLLQIDSINVLTRSHYLPMLARAGTYKPSTLDRHTLDARPRKSFEYWAHEASILPLDLHPLLRWRMARAANGQGIYKSLARFKEERADYLRDVLHFVRENGPTRVSDLPEPGERQAEMWGWSDGKTALEYLFWTGEVTTSKRRNFERIYDLTERVIPADILNTRTPGETDAIRELLRLSARAHGIGTEFDLRDYFRLPVAETKTALQQLVENGDLTEVHVEKWEKPAYLFKGAVLPSRATRSALLSPFDPLVWYRERAERIFNFHYRIEIYVPGPKRKFGYYVLPFLYKGQMVARLCLKADRQAGTLRVNSCHGETGTAGDGMIHEMAAHLHELASFLGLHQVSVMDQGDLAAALSAEIIRSR